MSSVEERLREAGLELPATGPRLGWYLPGVVHDGLVFVSGQTGIRDGVPVWRGSVGRDLTIANARASAALAALNALACLRALVGDLDRVARVVRLTAYVRGEPNLSDQPAVADGATEVLELAFGDGGRGARAAIGVYSLPQGAPVEIELTAALRDSPERQI